MTKLEDYYQFIDGLKTKGELPEEQKTLYKRIEEEIILDEVCRQVGEFFKNQLTTIRRPVSFIIDYDPEGQIVVKAAHSRSVIKQLNSPGNGCPNQNAEITQDFVPCRESLEQISAAVETPGLLQESEPKYTKKGKKRSPRINFRVFLNGIEVKAKDGAGILAETIRRIGFKEVAALDIPCAAGRYNLVDRRQRMDGGNVWQRKTGDWFIYTNSSSRDKINLIRKIAERLKIDLVVQE